MKGNYLVFKLNLQPNTIIDFKINGEFDYLINELVPTVLDHVIGIKQENSLFELLPRKFDEDGFEEEYLKLKAITLKLHGLYKKILLNYKEDGEIHYTKEFLRLNENCMRVRSEFEKKYPSIKKAYNLINDEKMEEELNFEFDNKIGTGITHLRKFYKIKLYKEIFKKKSISLLNLKAYYKPSTENIFVEAESESDAIDYIIELENIINNNPYTSAQIGMININPIYDLISFDQEKYSEISFVIVYPNGNPSLDRHNILKKSEAKELHTTLYGADGQPLKLESIEEELNEQAKKGYLKSIVVKGNSKGEKIIKKIKKITSLDTIF